MNLHSSYLEIKVKIAVYRTSFYIASAYDSAKMHLEFDGEDETEIIPIPNIVGFQKWGIIK